MTVYWTDADCDALRKQISGLCLRVSQNHDAHEKVAGEVAEIQMAQEGLTNLALRVHNQGVRIDELRAELRSSNPQTPGMLQLVPRLWKRVENLEARTGLGDNSDVHPQSLVERMGKCEHSAGSGLGDLHSRFEKLARSSEIASLQRDELMAKLIALEAKVEQIDEVLDHNTSAMNHATVCSVLDNLIKRINTLEFEQQSQKSDWDVDRPKPGPRYPPVHSASGVIHNFNSVDSLGPATVTLDSLADSRGLSVCIDGHHMRGHFLIIPWEAIDKKRLEAVKAKCAPLSDTFHAAPWRKP